MPEHLALIHVDAVLLQQVLVNLLDNADKYSPLALPIDILVEPLKLDSLYLSLIMALELMRFFRKRYLISFFVFMKKALKAVLDSAYQFVERLSRHMQAEFR